MANVVEANVVEANVVEANVTNTNATYPLTCVSGFWPVKNKHATKFREWFKTTLRINCPYVFFSDKQGIDYIKPFRAGLPTHYIECKIEEFYTYQYKAQMRTHPLHCPSAELNLIWHEKVFCIEKAAVLNPFRSEFFCWVDAGVCLYRTQVPPITPFPNLQKLKHLPRDKFIYSTSATPFHSELVTSQSYYHHLAGSAYILHASSIKPFVQLYKASLRQIFTNPKLYNSNLWTDQVVLTHIYKAHPHKFHKVGEGYGNVMKALA